jgi:hypothetical protein
MEHKPSSAAVVPYDSKSPNTTFFVMPDGMFDILRFGVFKKLSNEELLRLTRSCSKAIEKLVLRVLLERDSEEDNRLKRAILRTILARSKQNSLITEEFEKISPKKFDLESLRFSLLKIGLKTNWELHDILTFKIINLFFPHKLLFKDAFFLMDLKNKTEAGHENRENNGFMDFKSLSNIVLHTIGEEISVKSTEYLKEIFCSLIESYVFLMSEKEKIFILNKYIFPILSETDAYRFAGGCFKSLSSGLSSKTSLELLRNNLLDTIGNIVSSEIYNIAAECFKVLLTNLNEVDALTFYEKSHYLFGFHLSGFNKAQKKTEKYPSGWVWNYNSPTKYMLLVMIFAEILLPKMPLDKAKLFIKDILPYTYIHTYKGTDELSNRALSCSLKVLDSMPDILERYDFLRPIQKKEGKIEGVRIFNRRLEGDFIVPGGSWADRYNFELFGHHLQQWVDKSPVDDLFLLFEEIEPLLKEDAMNPFALFWIIYMLPKIPHPKTNMNRLEYINEKFSDANWMHYKRNWFFLRFLFKNLPVKEIIDLYKLISIKSLGFAAEIFILGVIILERLPVEDAHRFFIENMAQPNSKIYSLYGDEEDNCISIVAKKMTGMQALNFLYTLTFRPHHLNHDFLIKLFEIIVGNLSPTEAFQFFTGDFYKNSVADGKDNVFLLRDLVSDSVNCGNADNDILQLFFLMIFLKISNKDLNQREFFIENSKLILKIYKYIENRNIYGVPWKKFILSFVDKIDGRNLLEFLNLYNDQFLEKPIQFFINYYWIKKILIRLKDSEALSYFDAFLLKFVNKFSDLSKGDFYVVFHIKSFHLFLCKKNNSNINFQTKFLELKTDFLLLVKQYTDDYQKELMNEAGYWIREYISLISLQEKYDFISNLIKTQVNSNNIFLLKLLVDLLPQLADEQLQLIDKELPKKFVYSVEQTYAEKFQFLLNDLISWSQIGFVSYKNRDASQAAESIVTNIIAAIPFLNNTVRSMAGGKKIRFFDRYRSENLQLHLPDHAAEIFELYTPGKGGVNFLQLLTEMIKIMEQVKIKDQHPLTKIFYSALKRIGEDLGISVANVPKKTTSFPAALF